MDPQTELSDWRSKRQRHPSVLVRELQKDIIASTLIADPTFGNKKSIYTDFFASSKPLRRIETIMMEKVLPYYANTHTSTTSTSKCTSASVKRARETVARCTNAIQTPGHEHQTAVIFSGDGSTSAINKIRNVFRLGDEAYWIRRIPNDENSASAAAAADRNPPSTSKSLSAAHRPVVFISIQEHHSNLLPWRESCADVVVIPENVTTSTIDLIFLEKQLILYQHRPLKIGSFSAGSNLTGVLDTILSNDTIPPEYLDIRGTRDV
ncbi:hypothetical protein BGZ83_010799 [Gryganskiella cystojenkinii]|nr:hypothetical protein BGZ83_010799 [Gryganskiella cystojenkinii]